MASAVTQANITGNTVIQLADGTYQLSSFIYITADHVSIKGVAGNRNAVIIKGGGMNGSIPHVFLVTGSHFYLSDMTIGWVKNHGVQIQGEHNADYPHIKNVHFIDTNEQMLKTSAGSDASVYCDQGIIEQCVFEYTAGIGPQYYIGGIDVHKGRGWIVRDNTFYHIRSPEDRLAEHAIHFWRDSENTLVERNTIVNCDRGIGFGLGGSGHGGGIIRNNMVHTTRDVGIGLESSSNTNVYNNSVYTENYFNSIEYRFAATNGGSIINNLTNQAVRSRNGGAANLSNNITSAQVAWFEQADRGDLHLVRQTEVNNLVIDKGLDISDVSDDIDCQPRQNSKYDIGADEYYMKGDSNFDHQINLIDLNNMCSHWLSNCVYADWCNFCDFNQDRDVDMIDFMLLSLDWIN